MSYSSITVVLPTYNEAENIPKLVPELMALPLGLRVVIVDDGSPDGTGDLAEKLAQQYPGRVQVIHRSGKLGLGTAYLAGYRRAFDLHSDFILTMDADFSHRPSYIPEMVRASESADLVIGSRYVRGGGAVDSPFLRRLISRTANWLAHTLLGLKARDATAGFRLYRSEALRSVPLDRIFSSGYSFLVELLFHIEYRGWRVKEVPILFYDRILGQSKISKSEIFRAVSTIRRLTIARFTGVGDYRSAASATEQEAGTPPGSWKL
jgi:dolichol-phosphate mannosyltransferase